MFTSTRKNINVSAKDCIIQGISKDGGLFIVNEIPKFNLNLDSLNLSYQELTKQILKCFFTDFTDDELDEVILNSYNLDHFPDGLFKLKHASDCSFLELFHGPTLAFKDMALTILPNLLTCAKSSKKQNNKKTLILTATSGDTGGATLAGFMNVKDVEVVVLYPTKGVSSLQEAQMEYYNHDNCHVVSVEGNFDDCQTLVKKVFNELSSLKNYELSSANSINIGRLIPQIVYYFAGYLQMVKDGKLAFNDNLHVVVPTGNFGNILACIIAKKMGLPIGKIVCASNENKVLTDFFNTGIYSANRDFLVTHSPAMDILISSNLERLLYLESGSNTLLVESLMKDLKEKKEYKISEELKEKLSSILAYNLSDELTIDSIKACFDKENYLIDPHTAVAYGVYQKIKEKLVGSTLIVSTASCYKFIDTYKELFDLKGEKITLFKELESVSNIEIPSAIMDILNHSYKKTIWKKEEMEENLKKLIGEIDENN